MCKTYKDGIYPTKWSDVEGKRRIILPACPDCGKLFYGEVFPAFDAAQHSVVCPESHRLLTGDTRTAPNAARCK